MKKNSVFKLLQRSALVGLIAVATGPARADIFVDIPGIPGESLAEDHLDEIDAFAAGGNFSEKSCDAFFIEKQLDRATPLLISSAVTGRVFPSIVIDFTTASGSGARVEIAVITLNNAVISGVSASTSDGTTPTEHLTINAGDITVAYNRFAVDGSLIETITQNVVCSKR